MTTGPKDDDTWTDGPPRRPDTGTWSEEAATDGFVRPPPPAPKTFHRFEPTGERLGRGGLGVVDAVRDRDLGREVARKQLLIDGPGQRERFLREARITAQLEHPGIVPVYELGTTADQKPFYVMRRIRGRTLGLALAGCATLAERLAFLPAYVATCQAVAFAHARGVLHRDLKPDNVMVGEFGETLVVDWGLAKVGDEGDVDTAMTGQYPATSGAHLTRIGATMGTPAYMSPEQARGQTDRVDARSDVWSLGAILYELLAGRPLFDGLPGDTTVDRLRRGEFEGFDKLGDAPADLVAIVKKALHPDPDARYAHAGAIADEILRWQAGGLVGAYRYSLSELAWKTVQRHRGLVAASAIGLGVALGALGLSYAGIRAQRDRAVIAENAAADSARLANGRLARSLAEAAIGALVRHDPLSAHVLALGSLDLRESPEARGALVASTGDLPTLVAAVHLDDLCVELTIAADGAVACWEKDHLRVWTQFPGPSSTLALPAAHSREAWHVEWSDTGKRLVAVHYDGRIFVWDRGAPAVTPIAAEPGAAFFLDDDHLVVADWNGRIGVVDLADPAAGARWSTHRAAVRFDDIVPLDDGTVLVGSVVDPASRWDPRTDRWSPALAGRVTPNIAASRDGRVGVASGGWGDSATPLWLTDAAGTRAIDGVDSRSALAITDDGGRVIAATQTDVVVWDGPDWAIRIRLPADAPVVGAALSTDGATVLVSEADGDVRRWTLPPRRGRRPLDGGGTVWDVRATADGTWAASAGNDGVLRVWDPQTGDVVREHPLDPTGLGYFEIVDRDVVIATNARGLQRVSLDDGAIRWLQPMAGTINDVQRLDGGDLILANEGTGAMRIGPDGALRWQVPLDGWVVSAAPSGDEIWVAGLGGIDRLAGADGKKLAHIPYSGLSDTAKPTPEDRGAYVADLHGVAHIDAQGTITRRLAVPHEARVRCVAGDRDLLFTGDDSGTLCVWRDDVAKACWRAHGGVVWHVTPIGDQARIVTGGADGAVRFWELSAIDASVAEGLANAKQTYGLAPGDGQVVEVAPR